MKRLLPVSLVLFAVPAAPAAADAAPIARAAAVCADHSNQASAQRAKDTRDADGDGVYCEALPCPCAGVGSSSPSPSLNFSAPRKTDRAAARRRAKARAKQRKRRADERRRRLDEQRRRKIEEAGYVVVDVIDGDTVKVADDASGASFTVRLLGIDAPETRDPDAPVECGGREATSLLLQSTFTAPADTDGDTLLDARGGTGVTVDLTTDRSQAFKDRFGRVLAYVDVVTPQATFDLGGVALSSGLADRYVFGKRFARYRAYGSLATTARAGGLGVHAACGSDFHRPL